MTAVDSNAERTRAEYEMHMKAMRDRAWQLDESWQKGKKEGKMEGKMEERQKTYELIKLIKSGKTPDEAMTFLGLNDSPK